MVRFVDRWIYVFMTFLFLGLVLAGFVPDSIEKIGAVESGQRPPFPLILHAHSVAMGLWVLALVAQSVLMATQKAEFHKRFGVALIGLATLLVLVIFILVPVMRLQNAESILHAPAQISGKLREKFAVKLDILLIQIRHVTVFVVVTLIGVLARAKDGGLHKRFMIMGTAALIGAATDRIGWLPSTLPVSPLTNTLWPLVALLPMFLWDLYRLRTIHRAYFYYLSIVFIAEIPVYWLWGSPAWRSVALDLLGLRRIMG